METSNQCPFDPVEVCNGKETARFIVMRSTCMTAQKLTRVKEEKRWFTSHGILPSALLSLQEMAHHIYRFLYREVMVPKPWVQNQIEQFKSSIGLEGKQVIGIHIRTGGVSKEGIRWGRFLNERDVNLFYKYAVALTSELEAGKPIGQKKSLRPEMEGNVPAKRSVVWYVLSDQDSVKAQFAKKYPQYVVSTSCDMTHTNRGREVKADPGFTCALVENYLLSMSDVMILTTRSTYGYLARHRTNTPYVTVDIGDYAKWAKRSAAEKKKVPLEVWDVLDI